MSVRNVRKNSIRDQLCGFCTAQSTQLKGTSWDAILSFVIKAATLYNLTDKMIIPHIKTKCFPPFHLLKDSFIPSFIISNLIRAMADSHLFAFVSACSIFLCDSCLCRLVHLIFTLLLQLLGLFSFCCWTRPARSSGCFAFMSYCYLVLSNPRCALTWPYLLSTLFFLYYRYVSRVNVSRGRLFEMCIVCHSEGFCDHLSYFTSMHERGLFNLLHYN